MNANTYRSQKAAYWRLFAGCLFTIAGVLLVLSATAAFGAGDPQAETPPQRLTTPTGAVDTRPILAATETVRERAVMPTHAAPAELLSPPRWQWQHGAQGLHATYFVDANQGWAVGDWGLIVRTTDGGKSWQRQESGVANSLSRVQFVSASSGWTVGSQGRILHTTDGGQSWIAQASPVEDDLSALSFVDDQHGWIGAAGGVLRTSDGGHAWTIAGGVPDPVEDIQFFDNDEGVLICDRDIAWGGQILTSSDGGASWNPAPCTRPGSPFPCEAHFEAFSFPTRSHGVAVGGWVDPEFYVTEDGGAHWQEQETDVKGASPESVYFVDANNGWAVGAYDCGLLRTSDGGHTWNKLVPVLCDNSVRFTTLSKGFVTNSWSGISVTTDGGVSWSIPDAFDSRSTFHGVSFADSSTGWAVGGDWVAYEDYIGQIWRTTNSGQTWQIQRQEHQEPDSVILLDAYFVNAQRGWVVGNGGKILTTSDGGATWTNQTTGSAYNLQSVDFVDASYGWIAGETQNTGGGENGRVWRTSDGGTHWQQAGHFTGHWLGDEKYGVDFINRTVGYVVGQSDQWGSVYSTSDGGSTWEARPLGGDYPILRGVNFVNASEGWVVGDDGFIARTTDGGGNWELQASGTGQDLHAVSFFDDRLGYAVGGSYGSGVVLKTIDGGVNWFEEVTGPQRGMYDVASPDRNHVWIAGIAGIIRAYAGLAVATPTPTRTPTARPTVTPSPTLTASFTPTHTPTLVPTASVTPTPYSLPTPTSTATPVGAWLAWSEPDRALLVPPRGASLEVVFGNASLPATLNATLLGPAVFGDGSQAIAVELGNPAGGYVLDLRPAPGAKPGRSFILDVSLLDAHLERVGSIAQEFYLPLMAHNQS